MADNKVKFLRGTSAEYEVSAKDNDVFYYITDTQKLYLGTNEVTGEGITVDDGISFNIPETRENLVSGETIGKHFGKIAKVIDDLENGDISCPANGGSADTANKLVSSSYRTLTIDTSDWADNSSGGYISNITFEPALPYRNFIFDVVLSSDQSAAKLQLESWNYIMTDGRIEQTMVNNYTSNTLGFTFYAFTTKPTVALKIAIQGVS